MTQTTWTDGGRLKFRRKRVSLCGLSRITTSRRSLQRRMRQMTRRSISSIWRKAFTRNLNTLARNMGRAGVGVTARKTARLIQKTKGVTAPVLPKGPGDWLAGVVIGAAGTRRYRLYRPAHVSAGEEIPLLVMLHGCGQDASSFAAGSRMNRIAERERFMVLYPEQDRLANTQGCWNWFDTRARAARKTKRRC
jgi:Esterase PHB depolymerase